MVLIMNVLKSKKAKKPRGSLKAVEYDTEGNLLEKGYDMDTKDKVEEGNMSLKGGIGCSSQKKKKKAEGSNSDHGSDFLEEMIRGYQKKGSGGKGQGIKGHNDDRVSIPSDDEFLAHRMEMKRKLMRF